MTIQHWSEDILVVDLQNDPQFTDELNQLLDQVVDTPVHVVLDFSHITFLNSSNIAKLLKLRKIVMINHGQRLKLCGISTHVWGVFLVTGLDKVFEYADDVASGLTSLQMEG
jgi:anti-anti-sigma factor